MSSNVAPGFLNSVFIRIHFPIPIINFHIHLLLALFFAQISVAQDGLPIYSDYFADNYYLLHPSMAGAAAHNQLRLTARQQWFDDQDAPNLQTASVNDVEELSNALSAGLPDVSHLGAEPPKPCSGFAL